MKFETLQVAHALYSGAGTAGSVWAFSETDAGLLLIPLSVFLFLFGVDALRIYKHWMSTPHPKKLRAKHHD